VEQVLSDLSKDIWYVAGTWLMADRLANAPAAPVYLYVFTEKVKSVHLPEPRSFHGADTGYWFGARQDTSLAPVMSLFLGNFARSGDPNGEGMPAWDRHVPGCWRYMELGPLLGMSERLMSAETRTRVDFFNASYLERRVLAQGCELKAASL